MSEEKLREAEKKQRKREQGSDAKWRADLRVCYHLLNNICPLDELEQRQKKGGNITRLGSLEKTAEKIRELEHIISLLLAERAKTSDSVESLDDVRGHFSSLAAQVHQRHLEQSRSRLFTTHPAAQPICTARESFSDETLASSCCTLCTSSSSIADSFSSSEMSSTGFSSRNLSPNIDEMHEDLTHDSVGEDELGGSEPGIISCVREEGKSESAELDTAERCAREAEVREEAAIIEELNLKDSCLHSLQQLISADDIVSLDAQCFGDEVLEKPSQDCLANTNVCMEERVPDLHVYCNEDINLEMYRSHDWEFLSREADPLMCVNEKEDDTIQPRLSHQHSPTRTPTGDSEEAAHSLCCQMEQGDVAQCNVTLKMEP